MDDATFRNALVIGTIVLTLAPSVILFWFSRKFLMRVFFGLCRNTNPWIRLLNVGVCLFSGLMLSVIVGVFYQEAWMPGAYLLCDGQVNVLSQAISYKPGQSGSSLTLICTQANGKQISITLASIFLSALLYAVALFVLLELLGSIARTFRPLGES